MNDQITCTDELMDTLQSYQAEGLPAPVDAQFLLNSEAILVNTEEIEVRPTYITQSFVMEIE